MNTYVVNSDERRKGAKRTATYRGRDRGERCNKEPNETLMNKYSN
jgi:hypothetical protein